MHFSVTLFDGESEPRSFVVEPTSTATEAVLVPRLMRAIQQTIGANRVTVDSTTGITYPPVPLPEAVKFESAYLALYLHPESFRAVMKDPSKFPQIIERFIRKDGK